MTVKCNFRKLKLVTNPPGASGTNLILIPGLHELLKKKEIRRWGQQDAYQKARKGFQHFKTISETTDFQLPWKADGNP